MMPEFFKSEYFVPEPDNWHLKEDAPQELKEQFDKWMKEHDTEKNGKVID